MLLAQVCLSWGFVVDICGDRCGICGLCFAGKEITTGTLLNLRLVMKGKRLLISP